MAILLGLDVGDTRVGVALSDALGVAAHPLCTLTRKNRKVDLIAISDLVSIHKVERVVIACLSLSMVYRRTSEKSSEVCTNAWST